jgi:hypothetical protein
MTKTRNRTPLILHLNTQSPKSESRILTKSATRNPKPQTPNPKPQTPTPKSGNRNSASLPRSSTPRPRRPSRRCAPDRKLSLPHVVYCGVYLPDLCHQCCSSTSSCAPILSNRGHANLRRWTTDERLTTFGAGGAGGRREGVGAAAQRGGQRRRRAGRGRRMAAGPAPCAVGVAVRTRTPAGSGPAPCLPALYHVLGE